MAVDITRFVAMLMGIPPWGLLLSKISTPLGVVGMAAQCIGLGMLIGLVAGRFQQEVS